MANEAHKPCPFCGGTESHPVEDRDTSAWSVRCEQCSTAVGYSESEREAVEAWNRRAALSSDAVAGGEAAYWAVHTSTGVHVGLWPDKATAEKVVSEYPNGTLTALYLAPPETTQLQERVKELEWAFDSYTGQWWANSAIGQYRAWDIHGHAFFNIGSSPSHPGGKSIEEAKAAAQADYERRILSALEATPPAPKVTDAMVERACRVHNVGWSLWKEPQKKTAREVMYAALTAAQESGE